MIHPIILCGGSGSRLWPLSGSKCPKQFLKIFNNNKSLLQITLSRFHNNKNFQEPILITGEAYLDKVYEQLTEIGLNKFTIIAEPTPLSTAPAIGLAAFHIKKYFKDNIMLVMPSDSTMENLPAFLDYLEQAAEHLKIHNNLLLFGLKPTYPETGFGYIKPSYEDSAIKNIVKFMEKPNENVAVSYIKEGYLWNSGIFMFSSDTYLEELKNLEPNIYENCKNAYNYSVNKDNTILVNAEEYEKCQSLAIDYAIMEKTTNSVVIPVENLQWNDIGSWKSIYNLSQKDDQGNVFIGKVRALECTNCFVYSPDTVIALNNVHNQVIVNIDNKSLNISLDNTQKVKDLKNMLNKVVNHNTKFLIS